jgi:hypothetical protein
VDIAWKIEKYEDGTVVDYLKAVSCHLIGGTDEKY